MTLNIDMNRSVGRHDIKQIHAKVQLYKLSIQLFKKILYMIVTMKPLWLNSKLTIFPCPFIVAKCKGVRFSLLNWFNSIAFGLYWRIILHALRKPKNNRQKKIFRWYEHWVTDIRLLKIQLIDNIKKNTEWINLNFTNITVIWW